ncbi:DUF4345 domain-containing protein [Maribacter sp. CXY002]|uniref:DUF4345 domain-containing protein n=1 Tax=Maribacter luteocoastalis TaxID=3407671 RepID=UPI003B681556
MNRKNLHLLLSSIIVVLAGLAYGGYPTGFIPYFFGFEVEALGLKQILRAVMGIYLGVGIFWLIGCYKKTYWKAATLSNILFMGGISLGRIVSMLFDGVSIQFTIALLLELLFFVWGCFNLKVYQYSLYILNNR